MRDLDTDVLFKVLEMQCGVANDLRKKGRLRPASASLDRAFKEGRDRANAGEPAGLLACAAVRVQSCATLSQFGKHSEALEEACAAVLEMDKLWKELTVANGHVQAAVRDQRCVSESLDKLYPGLKALMLRPPKWLEKAVIVSVEAKHCVALELEYCVNEHEQLDFSASNFQPGASSATSQVMNISHPVPSQRPHSAPAGKSSAASSMGVQQLKVPWDLIERLHTDAVAMAELLLPEGHPSLVNSRRAELQARGRNPAISSRLASEAQQAAERAAEEERRRAAEEAERRAAEDAARRAAEEDAARRAEEEAARQRAMWRPNHELAEERAEQIVVQREKLEELFTGTATASETTCEQPEAAATSANEVLRSATSRPASAYPRSHSAAYLDGAFAVDGLGESPRPGTAPDLRHAAPMHHRRQRPQSCHGARSSSKGAGNGGRERVPDLFKDWKTSQSSYNQLSYIQKKLASETGVRDIQNQFRKEAQRFVHGYLKDTSADVLYENRTNFTPSMVAEKKRQEERRGAGPDTAPSQSNSASTAQLQKAIRKSWSSLYGFRDDDSVKKNPAAKEYNKWLNSNARQTGAPHCKQSGCRASAKQGRPQSALRP